MRTEPAPGTVDDIPVVWSETPADLWASLEVRGAGRHDPGVGVRLATAGDPWPCITFHDLPEAGIARGLEDEGRMRPAGRAALGAR